MTATDWKPVIDALSVQFSVATLMAALAALITVCIGLCFAWWGARKGIRMLMGAFRRGRIKI